MKNSKRLVTLLLALVMLVSAFTIGASATEPVTDPVTEPVTEEPVVTPAVDPDLTLTFDANGVSGAGSYTTTVKAGGSYKLPGDAAAVLWSGNGQLYPAGTVFTYDQLKAMASPAGVVGFVAFANTQGGGEGGGSGSGNGQVPPSVPSTPIITPATPTYPNGKYYLNVEAYVVGGAKYPVFTGWKDTPWFDSSWDDGRYGYYYYGADVSGFIANGDGYYTAGQPVRLTAKAPSKTNYKFLGWYTVNGQRIPGGMSITYKMPAGNTTVYAAFQIVDGYYYTNGCNNYHTHTIKYTDGVSNQVIFRDVVKTVRHGAATPTIKDPVRPGYRFVGWSPRVSRTATECVTYVAQWSSAVAPKFTSEHVAFLKGYGKGEFRPSNEMTRAEFAVLLYRLLDNNTLKAYYTTANTFSDVNSGDWYNEAISTLANAGVIENGNKYEPKEYITRAEMVSMLAAFYTPSCSYTYGCNYKDVPSNYWAYDAISFAQYMGWVKGYGANTFLPDATITRAEVAAILNRVLDRDCTVTDTKNYTDVAKDAWYYADVLEATIAH